MLVLIISTILYYLNHLIDVPTVPFKGWVHYRWGILSERAAWVFEDWLRDSYEEKTTQLKYGDRFILYTDGIP